MEELIKATTTWKMKSVFTIDGATIQLACDSNTVHVILHQLASLIPVTVINSTSVQSNLADLTIMVTELTTTFPQIYPSHVDRRNRLRKYLQSQLKCEVFINSYTIDHVYTLLVKCPSHQFEKLPVPVDVTPTDQGIIIEHPDQLYHQLWTYQSIQAKRLASSALDPFLIKDVIGVVETFM